MILPLPKGSNTSQIKDLRPISILPVTSKILERVMHTQLIEHFGFRNIIPPCQSDFRRGHTNDIIRGRDQGKLNLLVTVDYSRTFDTNDQCTLLSILHSVGCDSAVVAIICYYLKKRPQPLTLHQTLT